MERPGKTLMAKTVTNNTDLARAEILWKSADALRGQIDAAEYKHVVLGLLFLKYISDSFEARRESWSSLRALHFQTCSTCWRAKGSCAATSNCHRLKTLRTSMSVSISFWRSRRRRSREAWHCGSEWRVRSGYGTELTASILGRDLTAPRSPSPAPPERASPKRSPAKI